jgi:hypothetical protein
MATLLITKEAGGYFSFVVNGNTAGKVTNMRNDVLVFGTKCHFKTANGANIVKTQNIDVTAITLAASGTFTFANVNTFLAKLIDVGYYDWLLGGGGGTGANRFDGLLDTFSYFGKNGQCVIVNESQQKLETTTLYNKRKIIDLEDTFNTIIPNKMLVTNADGNRIELAELPTETEQFLNSVGSFVYGDNASNVTPINVFVNPINGVNIILNDKLGSLTNTSLAPFGVLEIIDINKNIVFKDLSVGDVVTITINLKVTTPTGQNTIKTFFRQDTAYEGDSFKKTLLGSSSVSVSAEQIVRVQNSIVLKSQDDITRFNFIELEVTADCTVKIDSFEFIVLRKNINVVDINAHVSIVKQTFGYDGISAKEFQLDNVPYNILSVIVNEKSLQPSQYALLPNNKLKINTTLVSNDGVTITYNYGLADTAYYTKAETDAKLQKIDVDFLGAITPTSTPTGVQDALWVASEAGTYTNFGAFVLTAGQRAEVSRVNGVFSTSITSVGTGGDSSIKSDKIVSENKITGITFTNGFYIRNSDRSVQSFGTLSYTNLISLEGIDTIKSVIYTFGDSASYVVYDANQVPTRSSLNSNGSITAPETIYIPIKVGEKYIRFVTSVVQQPNFFVDAVSLRTNELETLYDNFDNTNTLLGVFQNNQEIVDPNIATQPNSYYDVNGAIASFTGQPNEFNVSIGFIGAVANHSYKLNFSIQYGHLCFYNASKNLLSTLYFNSNTPDFIFTTPANCRYIRTTYKRTAGLKIKNNGLAYVLPAEITSEGQNITIPIKQGASSLGLLQTEPFPMTGYNHVIFYGQSLSTGEVSQQPISTTSIADCFMLGTNVFTFSNVLTPLASAVLGNSGEQPVVGAVNSLKKYINKTPYRNVKLIGSACGVGNRTIEQLSKARTESNGLSTGNIYNTRFIPCLDSAKTAVGVNPLVCTAIVWMQGEANQDPADYAGTGLTASLPQTHTKIGYKTLLRQLKSDMQADVMSKYSQTFKPLFFVYQTSNQYTYTGNIPITMAQYEVAQEDDDVVLLNPHYYCPTAENGGGHLNANGYRWYGEQVAKTLNTALLNNLDVASVMPRNFKIDNYDIYIDCFVPVPPLVLDIKAIQIQTGWGFTVKLGGVVRAIQSVTIIGGTTIKITVSTNLSVGVVDVSYGGSEQSGKGNVRDSDKCFSLTNYVDDTTLTLNNPPYTPLDSNNINFYGKRYPLWNWLSNFYFNIQ